MKRILIVGSSGSGKSTLGRQLADRLGLPLIHLDQYFWESGWKMVDGAEWRERNRQLIAGDQWIMDGNYSSTLLMRSDRADTLIFLDLPRWLCLWRIFRRRIRFHGRSRPDMPAGCPERIDRQFLTYVWRYKSERRPRMLEHLEDCREEGKTVLIFRRQSEVNQWLRSLEGEQIS